MRLPILAILAATLAMPTTAAPVSFGSNWKEQRFSLFSRNKYSFGGKSLGIMSQGSVSLAYAENSENLWDARSATWSWGVDQGVPATDLRNKGGDDRNLAMYMIFLPEADAKSLKGKSIRKLLNSDAVRVLVYVWGGDHKRGQMLASPYLGSRGKTVVLRGAGNGRHMEQVNLAADYKRAFGGEAGALVGFAVSADSDDTDSVIKASISSFSVN